jgi:PHD/YefM family antitoxin component YafN of YafNO toxin-antitoxin module
MNIYNKAIVSNSDMIKFYKLCRSKAESLGKIFILKNNQPDAVLFSISEYERLSPLIEYMESLQEADIAAVVASLPLAGNKRNYSIEHLKGDINSN